MQESKPLRKPGELGFSVLALLFGAAGYYFALDMTSGELSSPSVAPKVASIVIMAMALINFIKTLTKKEKVVATFATVTKYLFTRDVVVILVALAAYSVALPVVHFPIASLVFLIATLVYLQNFKRIPLCAGIALASVAVLVAIFNYIFKVQLP